MPGQGGQGGVHIKGGRRLDTGDQANCLVHEQHGRTVGQDAQYLLAAEAAYRRTLQSLAQPIPRGEQILPAVEVYQASHWNGQTGHIGAAAAASAGHHHGGVAFAFLGADKGCFREKRLQALDQGHSVIAGIAASAVAQADFRLIRHDAT